WAQRLECDSSQEGRPNREQSARSGPALCLRIALPESCVVLGHNRSLDFGAAIHQLLKDAIQFVQMRVAGDELVGLELSACDEVKRLAADRGSVVERGPHGDV